MYYVLWTATGNEEKTRQMIRSHVDPAYYSRVAIPYRKKRYFSGGKSSVVKEIIFPSYIFIQSEDIEGFVQQLGRFPGFKVVLHTEDVYSPIYRHEEYILTKLLNNEDIIDISEGYTVGEKIVVTKGPLLGFEGQIKKVIRRRGLAVLEMNIFNRPTEVRLGLELIKERK